MKKAPWFSVRLVVTGLLLLSCGPADPGFRVVENPAGPAAPVARPAARQARQVGLAYPKARRGSVVDDYHGTLVADPYRWLEDPNSAETRAWIEAENRITLAHLQTIGARKKIHALMTKLWNYERFGIPHKEGKRYLLTRNDGLQNQAVLYATRSLNKEPTVLLDPNKLSADGTAALGGYEASKNGTYLAYGVSVAGSDWKEWRVRDIKSGKDTSDHIRFMKFNGVSWTHDSKGFFYVRFPEPNAESKLEDISNGNKVYYHRLGTRQSEDTLIYERPDNKDWYLGAWVTDDGRYLMVTISRGTEDKPMVLYKDLHQGQRGKFVELIDKFENEYRLIDNKGPVFWFQTDRDAPRGRVIAIDLRHPDKKDWKEIIPQAPETLAKVTAVGNHFVAVYMKDAKSVAKVFDLKGKHVRDVELPGIGTAQGFDGRLRESETFYSFASYTSPAAIYRYDVRTGKSTVFRKPKVAFDASRYETTQVFFQSKDDTRVPMFLTHKKGIKLDGQNPTLLYGYGGFNIPSLPRFEVKPLAWMEMGGIYAVANLRGGSEYGEEWHRAGTKLKKQNVFDDFIAAAEWLIANKYTSSSKLAIHGRSNGGLLVGACLLQRPDLFGATLPAVGVMDMLRFHKFTVGWGWVDDYGSSDNANEFRAIVAFSPVHNTKLGTRYPPTMITTADHDDRVVPAHSFKFAAALQYAHRGEAPVLIRIETQAGHGAGKPTSKKIDEASDELTFVFGALKMSWPTEAEPAE